jgi:hypothetical protein
MHEADHDFFHGKSDQLAAFKVPVVTWHTPPGGFPWCELDENGKRLIEFAHLSGSYDWNNDPRQNEQEALLEQLASGDAEDAIEGDFELLWHTLLAVVRADRFNEGLVSSHSLALTRIANELRRRLILERRQSKNTSITNRSRGTATSHQDVDWEELPHA